MKDTLLLSTRKGLITYKKDPQGRWKYRSTAFIGIPVSLAHVDPFTNTWWACQDHGHWGCKLHRSGDEGSTWEEVEAPKYPEGEEVKAGIPASLKYMWACASGRSGHSAQLYIGTEPGGLFVSSDNGDTFTLNRPLWDHPSRKTQWFGGGRDHPGIHSIVVDPRDNDHFFIGISCAGVFETTDGGKSWEVRNKGLRAEFLPDEESDIGHDPHLLVACENHPDTLWQQNHCGIFRSTDGARQWEEISDKEGPAGFGFTIVADEHDAATAWVVPAVSDVTRVAVDTALCVCRTEDGGKTWQDFRKGLPQENAYDIVLRHAMAKAGDTLVFGTTTGNVYMSHDSGESWQALSHHLPMVHAVLFA